MKNIINKISKVPIKLINIFIKKFLIFLDYKFKFFTVHPDTQNKLFNKVNLFRQEARENLEQILNNNLNMSYSEDNNMFSEHLILFSALSKRKKIKNILEIGTFDGQTTLILKSLFEEAKLARESEWRASIVRRRFRAPWLSKWLSRYFRQQQPFHDVPLDRHDGR